MQGIFVEAKSWSDLYQTCKIGSLFVEKLSIHVTIIYILHIMQGIFVEAKSWSDLYQSVNVEYICQLFKNY